MVLPPWARVYWVPKFNHIVLDGLRSMFDQDAHFSIVGSASSAEEALKKLEIQTPDILITDYRLPAANGLELPIQVKEKYPSVKRVILSMHDEGLLVKQILKEGVDGYLLKSIQQTELKNALRQIFRGMPYVSPEITRLMLSEMLHEKPVAIINGSGTGDSKSDCEGVFQQNDF